MPITKLGKWSVGLTLAAVIVFVANIVVTQSGNQVTSTNGVESLNNDTVATGLLDYAALTMIFAGFIGGGTLGVMSLFRKERSVFVYLAVLFGIVALTVFIGGFFTTEA